MKIILLLTIFLAIPSFADDIEIYQGAQASTRPNVVMVMDTSRSMSRYEEDNLGNYNPEITYEKPINGYEPNSYYLSRISQGLGLSDTEIALIRSNKIHPTSLICPEAWNAINTAGVYSGGLYYWKKGTWGGGWLFNPLNPSVDYNPEHVVICQNQDRFVYKGVTYRYRRKGTSIPFTHDENWFFGNRQLMPPTHILSRVFKGNYLNYQLAKNSLTNKFYYSRMVIARRAAKDALKEAPGVNVALMRFDSTGNGGFVDMDMTPVENAHSIFENKVNNYFPWGGTPLEETYHEAYLYLTGNNSKYGKSTRSRRSGGFPDRSKVIDPGYILSDIGGDNIPTPSVPESYVGNSNNYERPQVSECTKSSIILFTDGYPSADTGSNSAIRRLVADKNLPSGMNKNCSGDGQCIDELAYYMANNDQFDDIDGKQTITTHVIGGYLGDSVQGEDISSADRFMTKVAESGSGTYTKADNYEAIKDAIVNALTTVSETSTSFNAPSIAVNSFNRLEKSDQVYLSLFQPSAKSNWLGNLKRYSLSSAGLRDANGNLAVDDTTGRFKYSARSIWSTVTDGDDIKLGGIANRLELERFVYTNLSGNSLTRVDQSLNEALLHPSSTQNAYLEELKHWIAGKNSDGTVRRELEDPLHSQPTIINYSGGESVAFIGTNSGYLHAFNVDETQPEELFAFIPKELLHNPDHYLSPRPAGSPKVYGLDGPISYWHDDHNLNGKVDGADKVILYVGMRRGGSSYYALDVTNKNAPKLLWKIHGKYAASAKNKPSITSGFDNLGQTWSKLIPAEIKWQGRRKVVLFAGAGYDTAEDGSTLAGPNNRLNHSVATTIYMIDAETGDLLWDAEKHATLETGHDMRSAFAADLSLIDRDADGFVDMFYAADIGGRLWRFDVNPSNSGTTAYEFAKGGIIADINHGSGAGNRRFYNQPDISYFQNKGDDFILISIGSGYRAHPLSRTNEDYFFLIKDHAALATPATYQITAFDNLEDWGSRSNAGWRYKLPRAAEKVLTNSVTLSGKVIFTAYKPTNVLDAGSTAGCQPDVGSSKLYSLDVHTDGLGEAKIEDPEIPGIPPPFIGDLNPTDPSNGSDSGDNSDNPKGFCSKSGTMTMVGLVSIESDKVPKCDVVTKRYWRELPNAPKQTDNSEDQNDDEKSDK